MRISFAQRKVGGFSLVELMVVVAIIGVLASLGIPQYRKFTARARQTEAKMTLDYISKLQTTFQADSDTFARWDYTTRYGYQGGGITQCDPEDAVNTASGVCSNTSFTTQTACTGGGGNWSYADPGAFQLGFKMSACDEMRYGYWISQKEDAGKERFLAIAFAPSDAGRRIYPNCVGTRAPSIEHPDSAWTGIDIVTLVGGDAHGVTEEKVIMHDDLIAHCETL